MYMYKIVYIVSFNFNLCFSRVAFYFGITNVKVKRSFTAAIRIQTQQGRTYRHRMTIDHNDKLSKSKKLKLKRHQNQIIKLCLIPGLYRINYTTNSLIGANRKFSLFSPLASVLYFLQHPDGIRRWMY